MKTRNGFVSNSSSSSFIIGHDEKLKNVTKQVWLDMFRNLYKDYDERVEEHRWFVVNEGIEDWYFPFCVFSLEEERDEAIREMSYLASWPAYGAAIKYGKLEKQKNMYEKWRGVLDKVEESIMEEMERKYPNCSITVDIKSYEVDDIEKRKPIHIYFHKRNKNGNPVKVVTLPLSERWINTIRHLKREMGICTMFDVMMNERAEFVIHFDENEYMQLEGIWEGKGNNWETVEATWGRVCEIVAKYLVKNKLVNGKFTWKDLNKAALSVNMHEG